MFPLLSLFSTMAPVFSSMTRLSTIVSATLLFSSSLVSATSEFAKTLNNTYDYVIVGGGVSGLVVANRLSANTGSMLADRTLETRLTIVQTLSLFSSMVPSTTRPPLCGPTMVPA